jgi:hypothetical protein
LKGTGKEGASSSSGAITESAGSEDGWEEGMLEGKGGKLKGRDEEEEVEEEKGRGGDVEGCEEGVVE